MAHMHHMPVVKNMQNSRGTGQLSSTANATQCPRAKQNEGHLMSGKAYARKTDRPGNPIVFMTFRFTFPDKTVLRSRIEIELYPAECPLAAENFRCLCTGERGRDPRTDVELWYKGVEMHKLLRGFTIAGGDIVRGDGVSNGVSIYGRQFEDDPMRRSFDTAGALGMQNNGPNTNGSQFFLTLTGEQQDALDGRHINFGQIVSGLDEFLACVKKVKAIEHHPQCHILITDCGELTGPGTPVYPTEPALTGGSKRPAPVQERTHHKGEFSNTSQSVEVEA